MLKIMLSNCGFNEIKQMKFCKSALPELEKPLVVQNVNIKWENLNPKFLKKNNLKNYYDYKKKKVC